MHFPLPRTRHPNDPDDGAKADHFRSGGAGDGAGATGAGALDAKAPRRCSAPMMANGTPVTSRALGGHTSGCLAGGVSGLSAMVDLSI
jgi:hypothetical protein